MKTNTMTMTNDEHQARTARSYKLILGFAMVSMTMMFAGLTSAFVISKSRGDWMKDFEIPMAFYASTIVIVCCSAAFHLAKLAIQKNNRKAVTAFLLLAFVLGVAFTALQFAGFGELMAQGFYVTGPGSNVTTTFVYVVAGAHLVHLLGGMISLLIIIYNHFKQKYNSSQTLGIELGAMYWHFLDFLWICLFLFLYFFK